ncbi:MAG: WG repeat-containing protein [Muribaculaceae bacterium]|nr:WG repeat-containing protein [Muribaculaceae bacterium]
MNFRSYTNSCLILILLLVLTFSAKSDSLKVERLAVDPMDITARTANVRDLDKELCALVRVALPIEGCKFEGNVVKAEYDVGEYLVFLSPGTKMFRIKCPGTVPVDVRFSQVSDIESIESGTTYSLYLSGYESLIPTENRKKADAGGNYLVLEVTPKTDVVVKVDDALQKVENGQALTFLRYGTHTYDVQAEGYAPEKGTVTIGKGDRTVVNVTLRSARATFNVKSETPGTSIYVNGKHVGTDTYLGELTAGTYLVEASKEGYGSFSKTVELAEGESTTLTIPALTPMYGALNVGYSPVESQVSIDGKIVGTSPGVFNDIIMGNHTISISKPGYATFTTTVNITEGEVVSLTGSLQQGEISQEFVNNMPKDYNKLENFSEGLASIMIGGKYGFIDKSGKLVIPAKYSVLDSFSEDLARVEIGGKWGFVDKSGKLIIPAEYNYADSFSDGLAIVKIGGKWGVIDKSGKLVIPAKYDNAGDFSEGLADVKIGEKWGFINKRGKLVIPAKYDYVSDFSDGLARVEIGGKWGFIDKRGKLVIPAEYDGCWKFSDGLARVEIGGKMGFIDKSGKLVIPAEYDYYWDFSEGLAGVEIGGKFGFIDKSGKLVIPAEYDYCDLFSDGLAIVKIGENYGFIDKSGKLVIPAEYDDATHFSEGLAMVKLGWKLGYVDKTGRSTFDFR